VKNEIITSKDIDDLHIFAKGILGRAANQKEYIINYFETLKNKMIPNEDNK
jgi:hypothetical protein